MFNNASVVHSVGLHLDPLPPSSNPRQRVKSDPCLPERLPSTGQSENHIYFSVLTLYKGFIHREAEQEAPKAIIRQLRRSPTPPLTDSEEASPRETRPRTSSTSSSSSRFSFPSSPTQTIASTTSWKDPQVCTYIFQISYDGCSSLLEAI
jgi:hypothetical protein